MKANIITKEERMMNELEKLANKKEFDLRVIDRMMKDNKGIDFIRCKGRE